MKENSGIEPGLLGTYRMLSAVLFGLSAILAFSIYQRIGYSNLPIKPIWTLPIGNLISFGLLYWPWFRKKTGKFFIPIVVTLTTVSNILTTYAIALNRSIPELNISIQVTGPQVITLPFQVQELSLIVSSWQLFPLLLIPLVMVAWQYNFRAVLGYIFGSTLLDLAAFLYILHQYNVFISAFSIIVVLMTRVFTFLVAGYLITQIMAAQRQQQEELREANQHLLGYTVTLEQLTTSRERNRLARELHDTVAHTLSGLSVQLSAIKTLWKKDPDNAEEKLDEAIQATRDGLNETRRSLQALRASPLEDLGLGLALQDLARSSAERCGATVRIEMPETSLELPPSISQAFYRAGQEMLENIARHAEATEIHLSLVLEGP